MAKNKRTHCYYCKEPYPPGWREARTKAKIEGTKKTLAEKKAAGLKHGRPKADHSRIYELKDAGHGIKEISYLVGKSKSTVSKALATRRRNAQVANNKDLEDSQTWLKNFVLTKEIL